MAPGIPPLCLPHHPRFAPASSIELASRGWGARVNRPSWTTRGTARRGVGCWGTSIIFIAANENLLTLHSRHGTILESSGRSWYRCDTRRSLGPSPCLVGETHQHHCDRCHCMARYLRWVATTVCSTTDSRSSYVNRMRVKSANLHSRKMQLSPWFTHCCCSMTRWLVIADGHLKPGTRSVAHSVPGSCFPASDPHQLHHCPLWFSSSCGSSFASILSASVSAILRSTVSVVSSQNSRDAHFQLFK